MKAFDFAVPIKGSKVPGGERSGFNPGWTWAINPPLPIPTCATGFAPSLDEAKVAFKEAWARFYASLTPHDIAHWHHHHDGQVETRRTSCKARPNLSMFAIVLVLFAATSRVSAADSQGRFEMGGGVGASGCPDFLNAMATARQRGGATSAEGVRVINSHIQYVLGFQTGFNVEAEGIYDIFASLGDNPAVNALYAIEPWCAQNPDKKWATGLLVLSSRLRKK
jgi:hypothetical protein